MQYKGFDESMEPERNAESPDLYYEGLDIKIDDYWPDRGDEAAQALYFQYHKIPEYQGMTYVPPPFREKYEICIWKVETKGLLKIKSSYFTPELAEFENPDFGGFEVQMALDHQTMILIENNAKKEEIIQKNTTVLIFDIYTLDKIAEFEVDNINDAYLDRDDYNEDNDHLNPQFSAT